MNIAVMRYVPRNAEDLDYDRHYQLIINSAIYKVVQI